MAKSGPIIVLEDDVDDEAILKAILKELNIENELVCFAKADEAFQYLKTTSQQPFIILSDVNLPGQSGLEFKRRLDSDEELRRKSIPFIFYSTSVSQKAVDIAYTQLTVQGFFQKHDSYNGIRDSIKLILDYWRACRHPNSLPG